MTRAWSVVAAAIVLPFLALTSGAEDPPLETSGHPKSISSRDDSTKARLETSALEYMRRADPEKAQRVEGLKSSDRTAYLRSILQTLTTMDGIDREEVRLLMNEYRLERLQQTGSPEFGRESQMQQLNDRSLRLAEAYEAAGSDAERGEFRIELVKVTEQLFGLREERRQHQLELMSERLEKLREELADRRKNKEEIVRKRVDQLLSDTRHLDW